MRIDIKTATKPIKDQDIKALYLLNRGLEISTERMRAANLNFILQKYGFTLERQNQI